MRAISSGTSCNSSTVSWTMWCILNEPWHHPAPSFPKKLFHGELVGMGHKVAAPPGRVEIMLIGRDFPTTILWLFTNFLTLVPLVAATGFPYVRMPALCPTIVSLYNFEGNQHPSFFSTLGVCKWGIPPILQQFSMGKK